MHLAGDERHQAAAMDVRKLRGTTLRVRYTYLRFIAVTEDGLETYQEVDPIRRLTSEGRHRHRPTGWLQL
jgi:hypothetical protein